ncbi:MAG: glutamine-hydrolyzing carbamoyl-phosphate synthase small subunit [Pseudomonadota bacterium]
MALLALEDGTIFHGEAVGAAGQACGEVVFNTAMTGYQEILTDPSYCRQIVTLTYPHIGNVGVNDQDAESGNVQAAGLIVKDVPRRHSNYRATQPLGEYLAERNVVAIAGIDTRKLTRILRDKGAQAGCIVSGFDPAEVQDAEARALAAARDFPGLGGMDLARVVTRSEVSEWGDSRWQHSQDLEGDENGKSADPRFHVVAYDFGVKHNILRLLVSAGCRVTVVPAMTPAEDALALKPDGIFLSNGPGDPEPCDYAISAITTFLEHRIPLFGICLGHQLLGLACGARSLKMKFGHHGANHPVQDLESGRVFITSQNHGFAIDEASLPANLTPTHRSLFDGSLQGVAHTELPAFGFQGHPEASPGPHDIRPLFERFVQQMDQRTEVAR